MRLSKFVPINLIQFTMNNSILHILAFFTIAIMSTTNTFAQSWSSMVDYDGQGRHHPITFSNDRYGYVIAGQNNIGEYLKDVHRYDSQTNSWQQLSDFPGGPRGFAYGVSDNQYAYLGFGSFGSSFPNDWWRYDMENDLWTSLADFPSGGRNHPALILANDKIYMGLGSNSTLGNLGDWWQYEIETDTWAEKAEFEFGNRHHPFYFGIDGIAYVGFGHGNSINGSLNIYNDFYKYDALQNSWVTLNDFPGEARVAGTQFSFNGKGYVLSGDGDNHGPLDSGEFWQYDPNTDSWEVLNSHPGSARWAPGCFVINCEVYLTSGYEDQTDIYHNDLVKYETGIECGCTDNIAINYNPNAEVEDGSCNYCEYNLLSVLIDQNNNQDSLNWEISINGEQSTIVSGSYGINNLCLQNNCYEINFSSSLSNLDSTSYQIVDTLGNIYASGILQNNNWSDTIEVGELECYQESYRCVNQQSCIDPMDGSGEYSSLNECQENCVVASVDDFNNSLVISPNPNSGSFEIYNNNIIEKLNITIYNYQGKLVYEDIILKDKAINIDLESQSSGLYFINLFNSQTFVTKKIILNK